MEQKARVTPNNKDQDLTPIIWRFAAFMLLFWIASCFFSPYYIHKRDSTGPNAVNDWREKYRSFHGRDPSSEQVEAYRARLKAEVECYIAAHPNLTDRRKLELRSRYVYPGMTKTEVRLFLNASVKVIQDPQELAKRAGKFWHELQGRVDEAWDYHPYTYFFQRDILIDIHIQVPAFQPL